MSNQSRRLREEFLPERLEPVFKDRHAVIVLMNAGETEEQAWQRYIKYHPKDIHAEVLIFTYAEVIFGSSSFNGNWC